MIISREEKGAQILVRKCSKKKEENKNRASFLANNTVSVLFNADARLQRA